VSKTFGHKHQISSEHCKETRKKGKKVKYAKSSKSKCFSAGSSSNKKNVGKNVQENGLAQMEKK